MHRKQVEPIGVDLASLASDIASCTLQKLSRKRIGVFVPRLAVIVNNDLHKLQF